MSAKSELGASERSQVKTRFVSDQNFQNCIQCVYQYKFLKIWRIIVFE
jgi:hypothetical protein